MTREARHRPNERPAVANPAFSAACGDERAFSKCSRGYGLPSTIDCSLSKAASSSPIRANRAAGRLRLTPRGPRRTSLRSSAAYGVSSSSL